MTLANYSVAPPDWTIRPLKHVVSINPEVLSEATDGDETIQYVDIAALEGGSADGLAPTEMRFSEAPSRARRVLRAGDTIVSTVRTYLKAIATFPTVEGNVIASTGFAVLRPNGNLHPRFAYWATLSEPFIESVVANSSGVSYPAIAPTTLGNLPILVPPPNIQERIANFLDDKTARIDALIAEKERLVERLAEQRQSWLSSVLFEGVTSDNTRLKFCLNGSLQYGATESGDPDVKGPRYIRITDIQADGALSSDSPKYLTKEQAQQYMLEDGDVLFARSGATVGKTFVYSDVMGPCAFAGYLIRARLNPTKLIPSYLKLITETHQYWAYLRGTETQSTIQNASAEKYADFSFPLPSTDVQVSMVAMLEKKLVEMTKLTMHAEQLIARLREYRSSLISAAVTGQLDLGAYDA